MKKWLTRYAISIIGFIAIGTFYYVGYSRVASMPCTPSFLIGACGLGLILVKSVLIVLSLAYLVWVIFLHKWATSNNRISETRRQVFVLGIITLFLLIPIIGYLYFSFSIDVEVYLRRDDGSLNRYSRRIL